MSEFQNNLHTLWSRVVPEQPVEVKVIVCGKEYTGNSMLAPNIAQAIRKRIYFTYRAGFLPIDRDPLGPGPLSFLPSMIFNSVPNSTLPAVFDNTRFTSDVGWGCMIRTSQSLLANSFEYLLLGQDPASLVPVTQQFSDDYNSPFSLHNFIKVASQLPLRVKPGEWFGPDAASLSILRLCSKFNSLHSTALPRIHVIISESCDIYDDQIEDHFSSNGLENSPNSSLLSDYCDITACPILVLFPIRLGTDKVNSYYYSSILQLLSLQQCVGIAGGKPSSSYYFFGFQDENLLYLDPHHLQVVSSDPETYHTSSCKLLPILSLDPSMLIGIVIRNLEDYQELKEKLVDENKIIHFYPGKTAMDDYVKVGSVSDIESLTSAEDFVALLDP